MQTEYEKPMSSHDKAVVTSFIESSRRERLLGFLSNHKKRRKFTSELAHRKSRFLDTRYLKSIPPSLQNPAGIYDLLRKLGAPERCWVISEGKLDGTESDLLSALEEIVGRDLGTILSCVPGRLAYFESEDERYILQR